MRWVAGFVVALSLLLITSPLHAQMEGPAYRNNSPPSLYTPPGPGAAAAIVGQALQRTLWAQDYGARCNGVTDDSKAFQNLLNEAVTLQVPARFIGNCVILTGLTITGSVDFGGFGMGSDHVQGVSSLALSAGINAITVNTNSPVRLHDFEVCYSSTSGSDAAITVTTPFTQNDNSVFSRLNLGFRCNSENGSEYGINFLKAGGWTIESSIFGCTTICVSIQNTNNIDGCDCFLRGSSFGGTGTAAVQFQSGGGIYILGNKFNGSWQTAVQVLLAAGVATSDFFVQNNSIEGTANVHIQFTRASSTGSLSNILIQGNEMASNAWPCVNIPNDSTGNWLTEVTVQNNVCNFPGGSATAFAFANTISGLFVSGNQINANGGVSNIATSVGTQNSSNCIIGPNMKLGTFSASSVSSCTTYSPD